MVYLKPGMPEESQDEIGTPAEAGQAAIDPGAEIADVSGQSIAQVLFDIAMASLLGIHIWRIGWEPFHVDVRMRGHIVLDDDRSMRV